MVTRTPALPLDLAPPKPWRRFIPSWLRSLIWVDSARNYDAFLSYSWKSDGKVAPVIQSVIQKFLCPGYRMRAKTIFRDLSCLPAGSSLEGELFERLDRSNHLIVLASPEAATSHGMEMEARHWFSRPRNGEVLIIVSAGECKTWEEIRDKALPAAVRSNLTSEPLWVSLQQRRDKILANPKDQQLRGELVEDLKQVLLRFYPDRDWEQLCGEERSQRRRAIGFWSGAALLFLALAVTAGWYAFYARQQRIIAESNERSATSRALANAALVRYGNGKQPDLKILLAVEAGKIADTFEARNAMLTILQSSPPLTYFHDGGSVNSVAFSDNGKLAFAGSDGTVEIWDIASYQSLILPAEKSQEHETGIKSIAFRPGGSVLATAKEDGSIRIWDIKNLRSLGDLSVDAGISSSMEVMFSPSGTLFSKLDDEIQMWNMENLKPVGNVAHGEVFSPQTDQMIATVRDNTVRFASFSAQQLGLTNQQPGSTLSIVGLVVGYSPDGRFLATEEKNEIVIWNLANGQHTRFTFANKSDVDCDSVKAVFSPDDLHLAAACGQSILLLSINLGNVAATETARSFGASGHVNALAFSSDSKLLASGSDDGSVTVWKVAPKEDTWPIGEVLPVEALSVAFSPDSKLLASGTGDGEIQLWNTATRQPVKGPIQALRSEVRTLAFSPDGGVVASGGEDEVVRFWRVPTLEASGELPGYKMAYSPDGRILAIALKSGQIQLYRPANREKIGLPLDANLQEHGSNNLIFSPDSKLLASGGEDTIVRIWDIQTRKLAHSLPGHKHSVAALAFSPDGKTLASGDTDHTLRWWTVSKEQGFGNAFNEMGAEIWSVAFNADGKIVALGREDTKMILLGFPSHDQIGAPFTITSNGEGLAFSPDGKLLAIASPDLVVLDMTIDSWEKKLCALVKRNLSLADWQQFMGDVPYHRTCPDLPDGKGAPVATQR